MYKFVVGERCIKISISISISISIRQSLAVLVAIDKGLVLVGAALFACQAF